MKRITVLLAEDHQIVREGVRSLLGLEPDIEVIGEAETGRQAVELTRKLRPAVVLMDLAMPSLNGLEATRQIRKEVPATRVLILSAHSDDAYVEEVAALGAAGFVLKQTSSRDLATAIREVQDGKAYYSPAVSKHLPDGSQKSFQRGAGNRLSSREVEVLQLLAEGKPNKQIAAELGVSFKTVDHHRQMLMQKLNLHTTAELTRYSIVEGIVESTSKPDCEYLAKTRCLKDARDGWRPGPVHPESWDWRPAKYATAHDTGTAGNDLAGRFESAALKGG